MSDRPWLPPVGFTPQAARLTNLRLGIVEATDRETWRADVRDVVTAQKIPKARVLSPWLPIRTDGAASDLSLALYGYLGANEQDPFCVPIPASSFEPDVRAGLEWCLRTESAKVTLEAGGALTVECASAVTVKVYGGAGVQLNPTKAVTLRRVARKDDPVVVNDAAFFAWVAAVSAVVFLAPPGTPLVSVAPPGAIPIASTGTITDGNPKVQTD